MNIRENSRIYKDHQRIYKDLSNKASQEFEKRAQDNASEWGLPLEEVKQILRENDLSPNSLTIN